MIVKVRVIPNAIENEVVSRIGSVLRVKVTASEVNEEANSALRHYLAEGTPLRSARPPVRVDMRRARWPGRSSG